MYCKRTALSETASSRATLERLRDQRYNRAITFRSSGHDLANFDLNEYLVPPLSRATTSNPLDIFADSPPSVSLLDSLPAFMALSAVAQSSKDQTTITDTWMRLAAGYMAQAIIEQYLVYGSTRHEVLQEAFAWGFDPECSAEEGSDEWQINALFWGEDDVVSGWEELRNAHMQAV